MFKEIIDKATKKVKKVFDTIFLKRKVSNWIETEDIEYDEDICEDKMLIIESLQEGRVNMAFYHFEALKRKQKSKEDLIEFKEYVNNLIDNKKLDYEKNGD